MPSPLDLFAEVADPSGAKYKWGPNEGPQDRVQGLSFRTKIGEGFSDASLTLARRIDLDYPDLNLVNTVTVVGGDGSVAYEGRLTEMPRSLDDKHSVGVSLAGWMSHAKDRKFAEIYVDRELGAWGPASRARRIAMLTSNYSMVDPEQVTDPTDSTAGFATAITGAWAAPYIPLAEAWYDAGAGLTIGALSLNWKREAATVDTTLGWTWNAHLSTDDKATTLQSSANLKAAGPGTVSLTANAATYRYALTEFFYGSTPAGSDSARFSIAWYKPAVYGNHGLTTYPGITGEPNGVRASDVVKNIVRRWCPMLKVGEVQDTSYVIQHLAFKDRTYPYDALLEVNKYHLWHLGVWENRTLHYRPYDLTEYDWEVRTDDPGTTIQLQGPSTDTLFNGIVVTYEDVLTGKKEVLTPDTQPLLADISPENPWNRTAVQRWDELELSSPTMGAQALQIGRAALADRNRPRTPGTITVQGYIRDRTGNPQPVWKVRAGDTVAVTNYPNDRPRLIHETSYSDDGKTNTLSIEAPASAMDAIFDRLGNALTARGLT